MASSPTARTVYLKLHPTPRSFPERREVLRVLERFGEVTMFKSYKYNPRTPTPNTFLALFASDKAAQDIINASPIRYRLIAHPPPSNPPSHSIGTSATPSRESAQEEDRQPSEAEADADADRHAPPEAERAREEERPFQLHAYPSTLSHSKLLSSPLHSPLHGPYKPITPRNSYIAASLSQILPKSISSAGLMDWETDSRRAGAKGADGDAEQGAAYFFERRERRRAERGIPRVMQGLARLRRERDAAGKEEEQEEGRGVGV